MQKSSEEIKSMFNQIAFGYDKLNNIISFGMHKFVKRICINKLDVKQNSVVIDLCCGSGDMSRLLSENKNIEKILGIDFSENMLKIANQKNKNNKISYIQADCTSLPVKNESVDVCVISFGLRNIADKDKCLQEIYRVLKPDGVFLNLDIVKNKNIVAGLFNSYVKKITKIILKNPSPYEYLIESRNKYYTHKELLDLFASKGFEITKNMVFAFGNISMQICKK